jgi:gamma-glutamyltranspeptidase/glutathione hydrolase
MHLIVEAFRRAYMDHSDYPADIDFVPFPMKQMLDPKYARAFAASIDPDKATSSAQLRRPAGFLPEPPKAESTFTESHNTTHFSVVDADGNAVSMTYTLNAGYGSGVTVEGLGFLLNDEMDDFSVKAGAPNLYGLIQSPNNAIAPGKRPLSMMTPTIVLGKGADSNKVSLVLGSPGGSTIPTTVINDLISVVDEGLNIQQAVDAPRFHHQYLPDTLRVESTMPAPVVDALRKMNYDVVVARNSWGDSECIARDPQTGWLEGGHDNRHNYGKAAGY